MVYKKAKQRVRRVYSRGKSLFGGDFFKNPYILGIGAGIVNNALAGKKIIDIENIKKRISKVDGTNPMILFGLGILAKNPIITAIGLFGIVDPPDEEKKEKYIGYSNIGENEEIHEYSNVGENQEQSEYSNVGENQEQSEYSNVGETQETPKKRFAY